MDTTPNLGLPYLAAAQSQKHVTHNEALRALDALVQLSVTSRAMPAPPATVADGDRYIVAATASGAWSGQALHIAAWQDGAWSFFVPRTGWLVYIADEAKLVVFDGAQWALTGGAISSVNPIALVGVNATADATNRLAVKSPATLLDNVGNGHQLKINKASPADTASLLLQDGYSGRAEIGLAGDDSLHIKISANGTTWKEAVVVDAASGVVSFPSGANGLQGATGPAGAAGATGLQGATGPIGPSGSSGITGPAGPQGLTGPAGPQGLTGLVGATGPQGPAGTSASIGVASTFALPTGMAPGTLLFVTNDVGGATPAFLDLDATSWRRVGDRAIVTPAVVAAPVFGLAGGTYNGAQSVAISCATAGAAIHYTLDGTTPTSASQTYSAPIAIPASKTIRAIATKSLLADSAVVTSAYTIIFGPQGQTLYLAEGDSITNGSLIAASMSYARLYAAQYPGRLTSVNNATPGNTLAQIAARASTDDALLASTATWRTAAILSILVGANDGSYSGGATAFAAALASYCDARRAAGWKVVVCTCLPAFGAGNAFDSFRLAVNTIIRTWVGVHCDAIADVGADAIIGQAAATDNTTYWNTDKVHPTAATAAIMKPYLEAAANSLTVPRSAQPSSYPTFNPADADSHVVLTNGNRTFSTTLLKTGARGTTWRDQGKFYCEFTLTNNRDQFVGFDNGAGSLVVQAGGSNNAGFAVWYGGLQNQLGMIPIAGMTLNINVTLPHVIQFAIDFDTGKLWIGLDGVWSGASAGDPASATNPSYTFNPNTRLFHMASGGVTTSSTSTVTIPTSAANLSFAVPAGYSVF